MMVNLNALNKWMPTAGSPPAQTRPVCLCLGVALRSLNQQGNKVYSLHFSHCFVLVPAACLCRLTQLLLLTQKSEIPRPTFDQLFRATALCSLRPPPLQTKHCTPAQCRTAIYEGNCFNRNETLGSLYSPLKACADTAGNNLLRYASGQKVLHKPPQNRRVFIRSNYFLLH